MEFLFKLPAFEGPLDLLLYLVRKKRVDVRDIPISQLADEFISYVEQMKRLDLKITSDFLTTAATLMELKSKYMLPSIEPKEIEKLQKQKEEIYRRIELYEKIKNLADDLKNSISKVGKRVPVRLPPVPFIDEQRLSKVFKSVVEELKIRSNVYRIRRQALNVEEIMENIIATLNSSQVELAEILRRGSNRYQIIIYLLATLELVFLGKVELVEDGNNIWVKRRKNGGFESAN